MQKFERFIIYPLLIVALFYSFAGEQATTTAQEVVDKLVVREISVVNDEGDEAVNIGSLGGAGTVEVKNNIMEETYSYINYNGFYSRGPKTRSSLESIGFRIRSSELDMDKENIVEIGRYSDDLSGFAEFYNSNGDSRVFIGANTEDHGLINIYDKYGEDFRSYSF